MQRRSLGVLVETISLQTPRGRLLFFAIASLAIFLLPYEWLGRLSLWQALGIPAPSIGLTRAYHLVLHGDIAGAWQRNWLIFVVIVVGGSLLVKDVLTLSYQHKARKTK